MMNLTRGELAKNSGVNRETVRYYERNELLPTPARTTSGYCLFPESTVRRIRFIKRAQAVGFSLDEIKILLDIKIASDATCGDVQEIVEVKLDEIDRKIAALQAMKRTLTNLMDVCPGGEDPVSECPILESFDATDELTIRV